MSVSGKFNKYAEKYDQSRKKLIPCYSDFYNTIIKIIPFATSTPLTVIDLGAGTGLLSKQIIATYPRSHITLVDISEEMLNIARDRLESFTNVEYQLFDYSHNKTYGKFDLIVSSLSIHHLADEDKLKTFRNINKSLNPNGLFINADQVSGETDQIENIFQSQWLAEVKKNGITDTELNEALDRMKEDKMSTLSSQLQWLKDTGFSEVTCWYQNFRFVVYSGMNI